MKILKYKKISNDKYEVILENNEKLLLYDDVIVKNNLLLSKDISSEMLKKIENQNNNFNVYNTAIKYISIRMRSKKEVQDYLDKKNISNILINDTINKLINEGYIDDIKFANAYFNDQFNLCSYGPYKIKKNLLDLGIDENVIDDIISNVDKSLIYEKLNVLINKQLKNKKGSINMVKLKILNYFYNLGFDKKDILKELNKINIKTDNDFLKKEYNKLYKKYEKKYETKDLEFFIANKLISKGYSKEEINSIK